MAERAIDDLREDIAPTIPEASAECEDETSLTRDTP